MLRRLYYPGRVPSPRLIKVACPQCGAGMRIDPRANVVTCGYCRLSSFVHLPNRAQPAPPPNTSGYGHIHVPQRTLRMVGIIVLVTTILPIVAAFGVIAVVIGVILFAGMCSMMPPPSPPTLPASPSPVPASPVNRASCDKAVACCRTIQGAAAQADALRACEGLRALPPAECAKQLETLARSAESMGRRCAR